MKKLLSEYDFPFLPSINFESEWERTALVANQHPWLTFSGYFKDEEHQKRYELECSPMRGFKIHEEWLKVMEVWDPSKWNDKYYLDQIYRSRYWLSQLEIIKRMNGRGPSYKLKDYCGNWWGNLADEFNIETSVSSRYICEGSLIIAGLSLGWKLSHGGAYLWESVYFPVSVRSLKRMTRGVIDPVFLL